MIYRSPDPDVTIPNLSVTDFVFEHAGGWSQRPAVIDSGTSEVVTFAALRSAVRSFAGGIRAAGLRRGEAVALHLHNCPEYAVAFHGIASAGGVATTANPLYTAGELGHVLRDSRARFLITAKNTADVARAAAAGSAVERVYVLGEDTEGDRFADLYGAEEGGAGAASRDTATMPYSSGTTGLAKGVVLSHRNLVANLCQVHSAMPLDERDVLIACLPFFHIYGMTVIMNHALRSGATLVTMPRFELEGFLRLVVEHRATRAFVVPPIALALAKHPLVDEYDLSSLTHVLSGAAPLGGELADAVSTRIGARVFQGFGMTETSPVTHLGRPPADRPHTVGAPVASTECRLVDPETGSDTQRGELWVRGPQVMQGYLNNPQATAETIVDGGWLRTGDIAIRHEDGSFEIVDRLKELIKFKGFQVPPAELEALLLAHPQVADAAVIGVPDEEAGELPKAFVVAADDALDGDEVMRWVAERVAPQKRIRLIETIDAIPKSPSGKILRRELRAL